MPGPLDGIKVLELTQIIAGPMCGVMLSDLGADVVKIESPQGDATRGVGQFMPNESKVFHVYNRGKRGIILNLQTEQGRTVVHHLIRGFDVFLINTRPGVAQRLGVDYETLRSHNERLDLPPEHCLWAGRSLRRSRWRRHHRAGLLGTHGGRREV